MKVIVLIVSFLLSASAQAFCPIPNASNPLEVQAYNRCLVEQRQAEALERQNQLLQMQQFQLRNQLRQQNNQQEWRLYQPYNFYE